MAKVSIVVNDYRSIHGINSVVDQFLLNRDLFIKRGHTIERVYDAAAGYTEIPPRQAGNGASTQRRLTLALKKTALYHSYLGQAATVLLRYRRNGRKVCSVYMKNHSDEDILISQDVFMSYYYLKHKGSARMVFMSHQYQDELEQLLISYPKLKGTRTEAMFRKVCRYVFENADGVVTICQAARRHVEEENRCRRLAVIYNSVQACAVETHPGTHDKIRFVLASSLSERKGIDILCQVLSQYNPQFRDSCEFHIFGDGDYFAALKKLSGQPGFDNLFVYGNKPKPYLQYGDKDVLLMTSRSETLPMSIIEAMSVGMPVLSTDVGAIAELVTDGENGFLVQPSPEEIREGIRKTIENRDRLQTMGVRSREMYQARFSNEVWVDQFSDLFAGL